MWCKINLVSKRISKKLKTIHFMDEKVNAKLREKQLCTLVPVYLLIIFILKQWLFTGLENNFELSFYKTFAGI